jgi:hypothetical protein
MSNVNFDLKYGQGFERSDDVRTSCYQIITESNRILAQLNEQKDFALETSQKPFLVKISCERAIILHFQCYFEFDILS